MMGMAFPHAMYVYSNGLERSGFKEVAILMVTQQGMSQELVAFSADGSVLITGARGNDDSVNNAGHVRVYEWSKEDSSEAWTQKGSTIKGEAVDDV